MMVSFGSVIMKNLSYVSERELFCGRFSFKFEEKAEILFTTELKNNMKFCYNCTSGHL